MTTVLDTNVISEVMRTDPVAKVVDWVDEHDVESLSMTAVTAAELLYGVARLPDGARKRELSFAVQALIRQDFAGRVLPFDADAAEHYAALVAQREGRGRPISAADAQIAAICRLRGATLATRNTRDFEETGIELVDPWNEDA